MPNLMDMLVGKLALRRELVSAASLRECMAEQQGQPGLGLGQILVRRRLLGSDQLVDLVQVAERADLACQRCQGRFAPGSLNPEGGLACPRCGASLQILFEGREVSDRFATGNTVRYQQGGYADPTPSSRKFHTRRDSSTASSRYNGPGSRKFRGSLTRGDFSGTFGNYEIVEELGRGGMGVVYKARQPHLDRFVALKILLAGELASSKQVKRFQREAEIAARLKHPNIVQVHDVGQVGEFHYFTMDFIEGAPLNKLIKQRKLGIRRAIEVALDVARGLDHAHQRGAIHRDIKPANLIVDTDGRGMITDFGLARDMDPNALSQLTRSGAAVGTPYYMSPEQAQGKRDKITGATDVYSLGVVLFEALTFELPFNAETQLELTTKILSEDPPRPTSIEPAIDRDVETIVLKALAKHPADRYPTAGAMADDLERYLHGEPIQARRAGPLEAVLRGVRRNLTKVAIAVLGLLVVALGTFALVRELDRRRGQAGAGTSPPPATATPSVTPSTTTPPADDAAQAADRARAELETAARTPHAEDYRSSLQRTLPTLREAIDLNPDDASLRLLRARALERLRRQQEAEADYRWVIDHQPEGAAGAEASFLLARMIHRLGGQDPAETARAVKVLEDALPRAQAEDAGVWRELIKASLALLRDQDPRGAGVSLSRARDQAPDQPEVYELLAAVQVASQQVEDSLQSFQRALDLDDKDAMAWSGIAQIQAAVGDERAADDALEHALQLDPLLESALVLRAQLNEARREYRRAIADLRLVLDQSPQDVDLLLKLASLYDLDDRPADADRMLQQATSLAPDDPRIHTVRGNRYLRRLDFHGALGELRQGVLQVFKEPKARERMLELYDRLVMGTGYLDELGKLADALEKAYPNDPDARLVRATFYFYGDQQEDCFQVLDAILKDAPRHLETRKLELQAVERYQSQEDFQQSLQRFAQDFGSDPDGLSWLAKLQALVLQDPQAAIQTANQALSLDPQNVEALLIQGYVCTRRQDFRQARDYLGRALQIDPSDPDVLAIAGSAEVELGNGKLAQSLLMQALRANPFRTDAAEGLAVLLRRAKRYDQIVGFIQQFMAPFEATKQPMPPNIAVILIDAYSKLGKFEQAISLAEQLADKLPGPDSFLALAEAYADAGRLDDARQAVDKVLEQDPEHKEALRLRQQLSQ